MAKKATKSTNAPQRSGFAARYGHLLTTDRVIIGGSVLLALILIGIFAINANQNRTVDIEGIVRSVGLARDHQENVNYPNTGLPPVGGTHNPVWMNCGIYDTPVRTDMAVHALEHGAVWVTYQPDLPADQVQKLRDMISCGDHLLLSPFPGLKSPVVASAWGLQLELPDANDGRLADFIRNYQNGPQTPEPGAACSGGFGQPIA
ncbi:MAG: DUF3105 domain-containing protein [Anaerolineae bacterium]|nr:DUF3105 domain-containing protein [Anaerolineae bacterium]